MKHQLVNSTTSIARFFFTAICSLFVLLLCCSFTPSGDDMVYWSGESSLPNPATGYTIEVYMNASWESQHPMGNIDVVLEGGQFLNVIYGAPGLVKASDIGFIGTIEIILPIEQGQSYPQIHRFFITQTGAGILTIVLDNL